MKQHKFFLRFVVLFCSLFFVFTTLFSLLSWNRYYGQLEDNTDLYYSKLAGAFAAAAEDKLRQLEKHASYVCVASKKTNSALWQGESLFAENPYWYYAAVEEVRNNYSAHGVSDFGIYYYHSQRVINKNSCMAGREYVQFVLGLDPDTFSFFDEENYRPSSVIFSTTNTSDRTSGGLLVGFCLQLGHNGDKVLLFYLVNAKDSESLNALAQLNDGIDFYILSRQDQSVYLSLRGDPMLPGVQEARAAPVNRSYPLTFLIRASSDAMTSSIIEFYRNMRLLWILGLLPMLITALVCLYIAYRPMRLLVKDLGGAPEDAGEIEAIRYALDSRNTQIEQQRTHMIHLLVSSLIHGDHISEKRLQRLGIDPGSASCYCVFLIEGDTLLAGTPERVAQIAEKAFGIRLYITESDDGPKILAIAFLQQKNSGEIGEFIGNWLNQHFEGEYKVKAGKTVDSLDDIRASFVSCYKLSDGKADMSQVRHDLKVMEDKEDKKKKQLQEILDYIEQHYCDADISQTQVAEVFHISSSTLSRVFRNQLEIGFSEYINAKRISYAKELLLNTSDGTRDIAQQVGLPNYNYFLRLFKSVVGLSPTTFREEHRA